MKKKLILLFLATGTALTAHAASINTAAELAAFAGAANAGGDLSAWADDDGVIRLGADIDLGKTKNMPPILRFEGTFDGCGHAIRNWKTTGGLFRLVTETGTVRNLTIDASCSMRADDDGREGLCAGFIADANHGVVEGCVNRGSIVHRSARSQADNYVGGVVGLNTYIVLRCRNFGAITSSGNGGGEAVLSLGGVLGGSSRRSRTGAFTAYCENEGTISYSGAFCTGYVGGITGYNNYVKVKFCTNRGEVSAAAKAGVDAAQASSLLAGGICGMAKGDVVCCDNFGAVSSRSGITTLIAGICGAAHSAMTVGDCANFGPITASGFSGASIGGIVGQSARSVVIVQCRNTAPVRFTGESIDLLTSVGGIAGCVYAKKEALYSAAIRDCRNEGAIFCASGGNMRNSIRGMHTGGICGYFAGNRNADGAMKYCVNTGEIRSESGRSGGIAGLAFCALVDSCENRGTVSGAAAALGGITAVAGRATLNGCVNRGKVTSDGKGCAGGIAGASQTDAPTDIRNCSNCGTIRGRFGLSASILGEGTNETDRIDGCGIGGSVGSPQQTAAGAAKVTASNFKLFITGRNIEKNNARVGEETPCFFWSGE